MDPVLSEQNDRPHGLVARLQGVLGFNNGERPSEGLTLWFRGFVNELEDAHARIRSRIDAVNAETNAELEVFQEKMRKTLQAEEARAEAEIVTSLRETVQKSIQEFESAVDVSRKNIVADFEQQAREKCGEATNDVAAVRSEILADAEKLRAEATDQLGSTRQGLEVLRSEIAARADHVRDEVAAELGNVQQGQEKLRAVRVQFLLDAKKLEDEGYSIIGEAQDNLSKLEEAYRNQFSDLTSALDGLSAFCKSKIEPAKERFEQRLSSIEKAVEDCASEEWERINTLKQESKAGIKNPRSELRPADQASNNLHQIADQAAGHIQPTTLLADPPNESTPIKPAASATETESLLRTLRNEPWIVVNDKALGEIQVLVFDGAEQRKRLYCGSSGCRDNPRGCEHVAKVQAFLAKKGVEVEP